MRTLDAKSTAALAGSRTGDTLTVWVWYGNQLAYPEPVRVTSWNLSYDTTRQVQSISLTIADPDGSRAPWLLSDPLGVGGSQLQVFYNIGGAGTIAYDWFRITEAAPDETWRSYLVTDRGAVNTDTMTPPDRTVRWVSGGADIKVTAETLTRNIANAKFQAPTSPASSATAVSEIRRLLADIIPVTVLPGVTDVNVPAGIVYPDDRMNAVQDLAKRMGADVRTNGSGVLEVYPITAAPVWTLAPGTEGFQIDVKRSMKLDGLYNVFIVDGTGSQSNQVPIRGIARITGGPLREGGPHGSFPTFASSNLITTQGDADAYAIQMRDTQLAMMTVPLVATCLPHPGLQQGDWISVKVPIVAPGRSYLVFPARVRTIELKGHDSTVDAMTLGLDASYSDVQAAFSVPQDQGTHVPDTKWRFSDDGDGTWAASGTPLTVYSDGTWVVVDQMTDNGNGTWTASTT